MKLFGLEIGKKKENLLEEGKGEQVGIKPENVAKVDNNSFFQETKISDAELKEINDEIESRQSQTIKFSPTKTIQTAKIIDIKLFVEKETGEEGVRYPLVYRYHVDNKEYKVIIGSMKSCEEFSAKARQIIELVRRQLVENLNNIDGPTKFEQLDKIEELIKGNPRIGIQPIPFDFTMEGINIVTQKDPFVKEYPRTMILKDAENGMVMDSLYSKKEISDMKKQKVTELAEIVKKEKEAEIQKKVKDRNQQVRNQKLALLPKELVKEYLIGEKIAQYVNEKNQCKNLDSLTSFCKIGVVDFMILNHENEKNDEIGENSNLEKYVRIKEKGFASDVIDILNQVDKTIYDSIGEKIDENKTDGIDRRIEKIQKIQEYRTAFELLKQGRRNNFNFALKLRKFNLNDLVELFENCGINDQEVLEFLQHEQEIAEKVDIKKDLTLEDYKNKDGIVKNYYKFMAETGIRNSTRQEEENMILMESDIISTVMLENNVKSMIVYSKIAGEEALYNYSEKSPTRDKVIAGWSKTLPKSITDIYKVTDKDLENYHDSNLRQKSLKELENEAKKGEER